MKKLFVVILAVLMTLCTAFNSFAADSDLALSGKTVVQHGDWVIERITQDTRWEIDEYIGTAESIVTPRFIDGLPVVAYGNHSCANNSVIKSVLTNTPLWTIGEFAFIDCTSLKTFTLNSSLHTIMTGAFSGTTSLKRINLEKTIITQLNPYTFRGSGLEKIKIPTTCQSIGAYCFSQCGSLLRAEIPDSVTEIADTAFYGCDNLVIVCNSDSYAAQYAKDNNIDLIEKDKILFGDTNGDGSVTIRDATYIQLKLIGQYLIEGEALYRADVDRDGVISIRDATYIQMLRARLIKDFENI